MEDNQDKTKLELKNPVIHQKNENCQVFNGPISGCVFAMPGATVNQSSVQQVDAREDEHQEPSDDSDEPLRNYIFDDRLFNTDNRLRRLRSCIAAAIDIDLADGEPQAVRINPEIRSEWYYIVKAIEEAKVARRFTVMDFIEQMREWLPMAFHKEATEEWEKYKRRLSKSISEEKSLWRHGKMQDIVSLREMWAKKRYISLNQAKMERIYAIAFQGLLANLTALKQEIEKENRGR